MERAPLMKKRYGTHLKRIYNRYNRRHPLCEDGSSGTSFHETGRASGFSGDAYHRKKTARCVIPRSLPTVVPIFKNATVSTSRRRETNYLPEAFHVMVALMILPSTSRLLLIRVRPISRSFTRPSTTEMLSWLFLVV